MENLDLERITGLKAVYPVPHADITQDFKTNPLSKELSQQCLLGEALQCHAWRFTIAPKAIHLAYCTYLSSLGQHCLRGGYYTPTKHPPTCWWEL